MNESLKKPEIYRKRYMKRKKMLCVLLDNEKDKDIIEWLATQENASESVRNVLHDFILLDGDYSKTCGGKENGYNDILIKTV